MTPSHIDTADIREKAETLAQTDRSENPNEWKQHARELLHAAHLDDCSTTKNESDRARQALKQSIRRSDALKIQHDLGIIGADGEVEHDGVIGRGDIAKLREEVGDGCATGDEGQRARDTDGLRYRDAATKVASRSESVGVDLKNLDPTFLKIVTDSQGNVKSLPELQTILSALESKEDTGDQWDYMKSLGYEDYGVFTRASTQVRRFRKELHAMIHFSVEIQKTVLSMLSEAKKR